MELPGDFFVDSMDVTLPWVTGLPGDEELLPPLLPGPGGAPGGAGSCHGECGDRRAPEGAGGFPPHPGEQDQAPLPAPRGMGAPQGGTPGSGTARCATSPWSSSGAKRLRLCHRSNFVWKNFLGFDLKMFEPRLKA